MIVLLQTVAMCRRIGAAGDRWHWRLCPIDLARGNPDTVVATDHPGDVPDATGGFVGAGSSAFADELCHSRPHAQAPGLPGGRGLGCLCSRGGDALYSQHGGCVAYPEEYAYRP
jgi:hypothetical protein